MSDSDQKNDFFSELGDELKQVWQDLGNAWRQTAVSLRNGFRQLRHAQFDYVVLALGGTLPERSEPPRSFIERQLPLPAPNLSIEQFNRRLARIAEADNVRGVLIICNGIGNGSAAIQNLRRSLERLAKQRAKRWCFTRPTWICATTTWPPPPTASSCPHRPRLMHLGCIRK
ncbi:MAG: hypothetical protein R3D55_14380 [Chloroflexota bacterium]